MDQSIFFYKYKLSLYHILRLRSEDLDHQSLEDVADVGLKVFLDFLLLFSFLVGLAHWREIYI